MIWYQNKNGTQHHPSCGITAERLVRHLERSGFVLMMPLA
jgi:hypothetical protein